jgi:hypothetical protein
MWSVLRAPWPTPSGDAKSARATDFIRMRPATSGLPQSLRCPRSLGSARTPSLRRTTESSENRHFPHRAELNVLRRWVWDETAH